MTASKPFLCLYSLIQLSIDAGTYSHDKSMDKFNRILVCTAFAKVSGPKPPRHMVKAITAHRRSSYFHQRLLQKAIKAPQHISTNPWLAEKNTTLLHQCPFCCTRQVHNKYFLQRVDLATHTTL